MKIYNSKKSRIYELSQLLVVGRIGVAISSITTYGFFRATIYIDDGGTIPAVCRFIVAEKIPDGWTGEIVTADRFAEYMDAHAVTPGAAPKLPSPTSGGSSASTISSVQRTGRTIATTGCCGGNRET